MCGQTKCSSLNTGWLIEIIVETNGRRLGDMFDISDAYTTKFTQLV